MQKKDILIEFRRIDTVGEESVVVVADGTGFIYPMGTTFTVDVNPSGHSVLPSQQFRRQFTIDPT